MTQNQTTPDNLADLKFEDAMAELEQLVERIESGEIGLEEALKRYERGTALVKHCRTVLNAAEQRIAELTTDADGELCIAGEDEPDQASADEDG